MDTFAKTAELTRLVPVPRDINVLPDGTVIRSAKQATMLTLLGNPRSDLTAECSAVTNPAIKPLLITASVGRFRVTGLRPAVDSLRAVFADIATEQPDVWAIAGSAGMLCVRHVRGVPGLISNHAWGTAIDLTLGGKLDPWNDGTTQYGLTLIAPIFARHGWYWGAGFRREDAMHFECGDDLIRKWAADGLFGKTPAPAAAQGILMIGDRGEEVVKLQEALNARGAGLLPDGIFGRDTQAALMRFQASAGLVADGVAGPRTWSALGDN